MALIDDLSKDTLETVLKVLLRSGDPVCFGWYRPAPNVDQSVDEVATVNSQVNKPKNEPETP